MRKRSCNVALRDCERAVVDAAAADAGVSRSEFLRAAAVGETCRVTSGAQRRRSATAMERCARAAWAAQQLAGWCADRDDDTSRKLLAAAALLRAAAAEAGRRTP